MFLNECAYNVTRYVDSWKRHQALWKTEKASVMDKFKMKHPTNADFEEKLVKYAKLADDVWRQASRSLTMKYKHKCAVIVYISLSYWT